MNASWPIVTLGVLAEFRNGLNYTQEARQSGGLPIVGVKDFQSRSTVDYSTLEELDPEAVSPADTLIEKNDLLFVRSNGNRELIGRSLFVIENPPRPTTFSGFTIRVRIKDARADPRFFSYLLRGPIVRKTLSRHGGGTNISNLNQGILGSLVVPLPPLDEQRRIASILSAYDDLIEVNRRRVAILEEMARRLFEEWFVHLRFPGHKAVPVHDTPDGPLPDGWKLGVLGELLTLHRGYDLSSGSRRPGQVPVMTASGRNGTHDEAKVSGPGVVTGRSGTIGRVFLVHENFWPLNTALYVSDYKNCTPAYALFVLRSLNLQAHATGAAVPTLNRNHVHLLPTLIPPAKFIQLFNGSVMPMLEGIRVIEKQCETLSTTRDLLLPRLLSGELSNFDAPAPELMLQAAD